MRRNPQASPHRTSSWKGTEECVWTYLGKKALQDTWEQTSDEIQAENHGYISQLRARVRMHRNLVLHRADPNANI